MSVWWKRVLEGVKGIKKIRWLLDWWRRRQGKPTQSVSVKPDGTIDVQQTGENSYVWLIFEDGEIREIKTRTGGSTRLKTEELRSHKKEFNPNET